MSVTLGFNLSNAFHVKHFIMKKIILIFLFASFSLNFASSEEEHPIYISIAEVEYLTGKGEIQCALKIFTDDLELAIRETGVKLNLDSAKEIETSDIYIEKYVKNNFQLDANADISEMQYVGKEYEEASTWIYFSFNVETELKELKVLNKVIIDLYESQKNIINIRKNRKLIKTTFTNKKTKSVRVDLS